MNVCWMIVFNICVCWVKSRIDGLREQWVPVLVEKWSCFWRPELEPVTETLSAWPPTLACSHSSGAGVTGELYTDILDKLTVKRKMNDTDVLADEEFSPRNATSEYLKTKVKPKEIVIIIFMMLLWLFSIMRYDMVQVNYDSL